MKFLEEFDLITKIPRPSHHEEKIAEYLVNWANKHQLDVMCDEFNNVIIKKPASVGYENYQPIALQSHSDMVCEKAEDVEHDFLTDPIKYFIDGDTVSTHGMTTLGADDGLGMSLILSILSNKNLKHPKLEAIFTTAEEEDFSGVENLDPSILSAKKLINIDHCDDSSILCASAGGITFTATHKFNLIPSKNLKSFEIVLSGLMGGHSGEDIGNGRGNANILLFRLLKELRKYDVKLNYVSGGSYRLAIPRTARSIILFDERQLENIKQKISEFLTIIKDEYVNFHELDIKFSECASDGNYIDDNSFEDLIKYSLTVPNGVFEMSSIFKNIVDTSSNLGEIYIKDDALVVIVDIRSNYNSKLTRITDLLEILAQQFNFKYDIWGKYFAWKYQKESDLRDLIYTTYSELSGNSPRIEAVHAGLECGFFAEKGFTDIISIGPNAKDFHSPSESFSISSAEYVYQALIKLLESTKFE